VQWFMSYRAHRKKKLSDGAENNTALASTGSNKITNNYRRRVREQLHAYTKMFLSAIMPS